MSILLKKKCCCGPQGCPGDVCLDMLGTTPSMWTVTLPALTVPPGCYEPLDDTWQDAEGSFSLSGSYGGDTYCVPQNVSNPCEWLRSVPDIGVTVTRYSVEPDCTGAISATTSTLLFQILAFPTEIVLYAYFDIPTGPLILFQAVYPFATYPDIAAAGATTTGVDPGPDPGSIATTGSRFAATDTGSGTLTPCCAEEPAPEEMAMASTAIGPSFILQDDAEAVATESRRLKAGGCCGAPSTA